MSKEWKCADCVKYKTDACSTCACGYTPTVSCRDVLVDFDYAYEQGRADAIDEFADSTVIKIGLLKQSADDEWVEYALNEIKKFVMNKAYELKEQKND